MTAGTRDTICAAATAPGRAGVAIVRVSGPEAIALCERLTGRPPPSPRHAALRVFSDPETGAAIDRGLVLTFPGAASFTGEPVCELHCHGGPAVVRDLIAALLATKRVRLAHPGEFTRRAFHAGKLDLTEVEGLADLVSAETSAQRRLAYGQMEGALGRLFDGWRNRLVRAGAMLEASIDFPDEDLPEAVLAQARPLLVDVLAEIDRHLAEGSRGERLREGMSVALVGPPNAGKSSLLNALARRDVAIVSAQPGTTRDVLEVRLDLQGYPVNVYDLAGLRETEEAVEAEGVRRARLRAAEADVRVCLWDARDAPDWRGLGVMPTEIDIVVASKCDLTAGAPDGDTVRLSVLTGEGLDRLLLLIQSRAVSLMGGGEGVLLTRARHREHLRAIGKHVRAVIEAENMEPELAAEELRLALAEIGRLTGRVDVEDLLDVVFSEFCIGK